jgi:hypothetical protein
VKELANRLLATAIVLLVAALVLRWVWQIIRPLAPGLVVVALAVFIIRWLRARQQRW